MELIIAPSGQGTAVYDEAIPLEALGALAIRRASHVEPTAEGLWAVDLSPVGGPSLGPFARRSAALAAERQWLEQHLPGLPLVHAHPPIIPHQGPQEAMDRR